MKVITQLEEYHYKCDECKRKILKDVDEQLMGTVTYGVWSNGTDRIYKRTKHYCVSCLKRKGIV